MKNFLFFLTISLVFSLKAQNNEIKGRVYDAQNGEILPFANVYVPGWKGVTTDEQGVFLLKLPDTISTFKVSYTGYETLPVPIDKNKDFYSISLPPVKEKLQEVYLRAKGRNPAIALLQQAIKRKKQNDYRRQKTSITTLSYFLFKLTADRDSLRCIPDTLTIYHKNEKKIIIDSSLYNLCRDLDNKELYMMETLSENQIGEGEIRHKILATRTAGLKNPLYEILQLQFSGKSPYDDYYKIIFKEYLGPFSKKSFAQYRYKLVDTIEKQGRQLYKIHFIKKEKPGITGDLFLDSESLALAGLQLRAKGQLIITTTYEFAYFDTQKLWIPVLQRSILRMSKNFTGLTVGNEMESPRNSSPEDSIKHTNPQRTSDVLYAKIIDSLVKIDFRKKSKKPFYSLQIEPGASQKGEDYWTKMLGKTLSKREKNTYKTMDSMFQAENVEKNIRRYKRLIYGKMPLGIVDLDLSRLTHTNLYEGLRLETNFTTNERFSDRWVLNAYAAYGSKDKAWKYHFRADYKISHRLQTYIGLSFTGDLEKAAVFEPVQKPPLLTSVFNHYPWEKFTAFKEVSLHFTSLISQHSQISLQASRGFYESKFALPFHPGRIEFPEYDLSRWKIKWLWEPHSKYLLEERGRRKIKNGYPKFSWILEGNIPEWQTDRRYYLRTGMQGIFRKTYLNKDYMDVKIQLGMTFGTPRIQQLFQADFNDYKGGYFWQHLMFNNPYSFETVKDFEFLNNYLASVHLSHRINGIKIYKNKKIDLRFTTAVAYGFAWDENIYAGSSDLRNGLFESGVEIYKLMKGFGLGVYYRYGAYASSQNKENWSLRINLNPWSLFD